MSRRRIAANNDRRERAALGASPDDLLDYFRSPQRRVGRPAKHALETWRVIDDWPERVPVTETEVDVFEAWFGDIFDEFF
jgi:hypothetical protein